jgi:hypothetical protein
MQFLTSLELFHDLVLTLITAFGEGGRGQCPRDRFAARGHRRQAQAALSAGWGRHDGNGRLLKDRLNSLKSDRDRIKAARERAKSHSSQAIQIDPALLEQFGRSMRESFTSRSIPFRKAYLQSLIEVIEVDDTQIRIKGSKDVLERAILPSRNGAITGWRSLQNKTANSYVIEIAI